jgi:hypothetical protein
MYLPATGLGAYKGLGDCGCGGACGTCVGQVQGDAICKSPGMGAYGTVRSMYGTGYGLDAGLGLFDSMDFTTWGVPEWGLIILGGYFLFSGIFTGATGVRRIKKGAKKRRTRRKRELEKEASLL